MNLVPNVTYQECALKLLGEQSLYMMSPTENWDGVPLSATSLRMETHFTKLTEEVFEPDLTALKSIISNFSTTEASKYPEYALCTEVLNVAADIARSSKHLLKKSTGLRETEVRFSLIDPFIKGILELTRCKVTLEESVKLSDSSLKWGHHSSTTVSNRSIPDYSVYNVTSRDAIKVLILEAKTDKSLNDDSICQAIGYYIASDTSHLREENGKICPPLVLVMTQTRIQFIFFPFTNAVDAVVTSEILLHDQDKFLDMKVFSEVFTYVVEYVFLSRANTIDSPMSRELLLHKKTAYHTLVVPDTTKVQSLLEEEKKRIIEENEKEKKQIIEEKEKIIEEKEKIIEEKKKIIEKNNKLMEEKEKKLADLLRQLEEPPSKRKKLEY